MEMSERFEQTKAKLDLVSPTLCLAKWKQVTLHLQNGFNHSCHHPASHQTPRELLEKDPSALHNTPFKKEMRRMMKKGERPPECEYCWKVEDAPGKHFSDRVLKSSDSWANPFFEEIAEIDPEKNVNPSYLEVSFGSECNFSCVYCAPHISSSIYQSYKKHGPYIYRPSLSEIERQGLTPLPTDKNPYVDAFWKWFPDLAKDLKVFRVTGGEPLVNANTYRILDYFEANPNPDLQLCVNSNFGIHERYFEKFIAKVSALTKSGKIKDFIMFTSIDTEGAHAEYLRTGLDYQLWKSRVNTYLSELPWKLVYMVTFNVLSVARFDWLLKDLIEINAKHPSPVGDPEKKRTIIDISHLNHPEYLSPWILTDPWKSRINSIARFMEENSSANIGPKGFFDYEIHKINRISSWAKATNSSQGNGPDFFRALFYIFAKQHEVREGKNFLQVFPEYADYFAVCRESLDGQDQTFRDRFLGKIDQQPQL